MQLKGKQIKDTSIEQNKLDITTDSIVSVSSVTNVDFVEQQTYDRIEDIAYSTLNNNMTANNATIGELACNIHVIEFPVSPIIVKINSIAVTVGVGKDCYFKSSDGNTVRTDGNALKSDLLYWNSGRFDLDINDDITFEFITLVEGVVVNENTPIILDTYYPSLNVKYTGADDTNTTMEIDGVIFTVGNVAGVFVWDIGGPNETTLSVPGDFVIQDVNGEDYTIWFDGFGSLFFSIKKGLFTVPIIYPSYGMGFNSYVYSIIKDGDKQVVVGNFTTYNNTNVNRIVRLDKAGNIDNSFNFGTGLDNKATKIIEHNNKYIVVGNFTTYNNNASNRIVSINKDGSVDTSFDVGIGFNYQVNDIIIDNNNKLVAVGQFHSYDGTNRLHCIRLNDNGSVDISFGSISISSENTINTIIHDIDNKYVVGTSNIQGTSGISNGNFIVRYIL